MTDFRTYHTGDASELVALWNRSQPRDPVTYDWFCDYVLLDPNFDPAGMQIACHDGQIVGCAHAVRRLTPAAGTELEPDTGWISFLFVAPEARGTGIGGELVDRAEAFLVGHGRSIIDFACYTPNYFAPGIDPETYPEGAKLLQRKGFEVRSSPVAMDVSLVGYAVPDDVAELRRTREMERYTFCVPRRDELPDVIDFAARVFSADWGEAIRDGALAGRPMDHFLVARQDGRVVGFCMYGAYRGIRERFGPFGVDPDQRGTGLGKILLYECLAQMRAHGLHTAWFLWTGEQSPAGHLYYRAGFTVTRRYDVVRKTLKAG